ncbi:Rz1-like lysis system protein LysC [Pantoea sp. y20]
MLSAGCVKKQIVYVPAQCPRLPAELMQATAVPEPRMAGSRLSWGESLEWNDALLDALDSANKDKASLLKADSIRAGD